MGCKLRVCYFKPESELNPLSVERYEANILGCTRQFRYFLKSTNIIDMVLSINGIPVVALELKKQLTGQDVNCVMQYKEYRSCKLSVSEYVRQIATIHNPKALPPEEFYEILDFLKICKSNIEANMSWRFGKHELNTLIDLYNTFDERVQTYYENDAGGEAK